MSAPQSVLVVEDEHSIASFVALYLKNAGYAVRTAGTGAAALNAVAAEMPSLILLDLNLPDMDGIEICRRVRKSSDVPILMLTAKDTLQDKIHGFDCGADDYLTKPFEFEELLVRLKALSRRQPLIKASVQLQVADLTLDRDSREVHRGGARITLTRKEFLLLEYLMAHAGKAVSRTSILEQVWGYHHDTLTNSIDVYIGSLRKKVDAGRETKLIHTVRDFGYKITETS